jgi:hypothetical protein
MPLADSGAKEIFEEMPARSAADGGGLRRIEMPVCVHNRLGTKAAQGQDKDDVLEDAHVASPPFDGCLMGGDLRKCRHPLCDRYHVERLYEGVSR